MVWWCGGVVWCGVRCWCGGGVDSVEMGFDGSGFVGVVLMGSR